MALVQRSTLIVGLDPGLVERLAPVLRTAQLFADSLETGAAALESAGFLPFDAILAGYPLPDMPMQQFLDALRATNSPCRQSAIVLLAETADRDAADTFIGRGANRVLTATDPPEQVPHLLYHLLEIPPRFAVRVPSRVRVQLARGTSFILCQTENLSMSGMLLRTEQSYPVGTKVNFDLMLPGETSAVRGQAVVVRQTMARRETVAGVGVRFVSFEASDKARFEAAVSRLRS